MKTTRSFEMADRYIYDLGVCSIKRGFAQVDTSQDASYFGTWANPSKWAIVCYCEGDVTLQQADSAEEFVSAIRELKQWNEENGHKFYGIDPGFIEALADGFKVLGLGDLLH